MRISYLAVAVACMVSMSTSALAQSGSAPPLRPERHRLDLDGDGLPDEIIVHPTAHPDGEGAYDRLELRLSRAGKHFLTGSWDAASPGDQSLVANLIQSRVVFVGRFPSAGTLVFLFGEALGCCAQGLDIYVLPNGVSRSTSADRSSCSCSRSTCQRRKLRRLSVRRVSRRLPALPPQTPRSRVPTIQCSFFASLSDRNLIRQRRRKQHARHSVASPGCRIART